MRLINGKITVVFLSASKQTDKQQRKSFPSDCDNMKWRQQGMNRHKGFRVITSSSGVSIRKTLCYYGVGAKFRETQCYISSTARLKQGLEKTQTAASAFLFLMAYPLMATSLLSLPPILLPLYLFSRAFS